MDGRREERERLGHQRHRLLSDITVEHWSRVSRVRWRGIIGSQ